MSAMCSFFLRGEAWKALMGFKVEKANEVLEGVLKLQTETQVWGCGACAACGRASDVPKAFTLGS